MVFLAAGIALALLAGCATEPMMQPQPIAVPAGLSVQQVRSAVAKALIGRGWVLTGSTPNSYDARLTGDDWQANIRTSFDTKQVTIRYLSSHGLHYTPGHKELITQADTGVVEPGNEPQYRRVDDAINPHWNIWMRNLEHDIPAQLSLKVYGTQ
ncbi:MAG TPA: hypothetical protein VFX38_01645 [Gammaproteobacteria bacterium]|nr:hypothetical protein [Gammaproteobacteria bacterium]